MTNRSVNRIQIVTIPERLGKLHDSGLQEVLYKLTGWYPIYIIYLVLSSARKEKIFKEFICIFKCV